MQYHTKMSHLPQRLQVRDVLAEGECLANAAQTAVSIQASQSRPSTCTQGKHLLMASRTEHIIPELTLKCTLRVS